MSSLPERKVHSSSAYGFSFTDPVIFGSRPLSLEIASDVAQAGLPHEMHCVAKNDLELLVLPSSPPTFWNCKHVPPCSVHALRGVGGIKPQASGH